ncbi:hypothetical protein Sjap_007526 [Stephania japonica]|uniref:GTP-eEF1A C-terminal domain-containing protein n=1 Tax=Stephania japonica TaxID=461633 RepID=A0AAP0JMW3_9MAGN
MTNPIKPQTLIPLGLATVAEDDEATILEIKASPVSPQPTRSALKMLRSEGEEEKLVPAVSEFDAQLQTMELLDNEIFTAGYNAVVMHIHCIVEELEIFKLLHQIDPKTKKPMKKM